MAQIGDKDPFFLITVDTEGDNLWSKPRKITTHNAEYLPRFQDLCERHGMKPTYLVNWEMVESPVFVEFARDVLKRRVGEVGMHLHAWNSPPISPLTEDDELYQPYLIEYPENVIREKVRIITDKLEKEFGVKMVSHRAGRWGFNALYARILSEHGYLVDCSVTPHISWRSNEGAPNREGGSDYTSFPELAYFLDLDNISRPGNSLLLEVPVSVIRKPRLESLKTATSGLNQNHSLSKVLNRFFPILMNRPEGHNLPDLKTILNSAIQKKRDYVEFVLHSSELMPGGSPTFPTVQSIEKLLRPRDTFQSSQLFI